MRPQPQRPAQLMQTQLTRSKHSPAQHMQNELPPTLPSLSLSPLPTPRLFSRSRSVNRIGSSPSSLPMHQRTHSESNESRQPLLGITLCAETKPSPTTDHQIKTISKPLSSIKTINGKNICNPYLFWGAPMVTTSVRLAGNHTRELWRFLQEASHADILLAELAHSSLKEMSCFCSGMVPIYVHPSFYRTLKLKSVEFPGTAELLLNSVPVPCVRLSASSPRRISAP